MNNTIEKLNFKKIIMLYIISALIIGIILIIFTFTKYKDKINLLYKYHDISESFKEQNYNEEKVKSKINNLSQNSNDIVDILILNSNNKIKYSSNGKYTDELLLESVSGEKDYYLNNNNSTLFKLIKGKNLAIQSFLSEEYIAEYFDSDNDAFYEASFNTKNNYYIAYAINKYSKDKLYFIIDLTPVSGGALCLKIDLVILVFYFMLYWIILALMIYQNALKINLNPYFWGGITLLTNIVGAIIYLIYKKSGIVCDTCHTYQNKTNIYCTACGNKLNDTCINCNHIIKEKELYCSNCGSRKQ